MLRILIVTTLFFVSVVAHAATLNEKRPPDYFRMPGQDGEKYLFPTKLEKPCNVQENRSGFCPNIGTGETRGWVMARYKSRHAGGFDGGTPSLLMVYIPPGAKVNGTSDKVHRWLNFALPHLATDNATVLANAEIETAPYVSPTPLSPIPENYESNWPRTFTMVSATEGSPAAVHFQKFSRSGGDNFYTPESESFPSGCYSCHPNGLRAISPLGYHVDSVEANNKATMLNDNGWKAVNAINEAMVKVAGGKTFVWDNFDPKATYKKVIGPSTPIDPKTRSKDYILGTSSQTECATNASGANCGCARAQESYSITDIFGRAPGKKNVYKMDRNAALDWEKIAGAMDCEMCHDNTGRGAITEGTGAAQINFKLLVDQSMPFGAHSNPLEGGYSNDLDVNHRIALANCLRKEFEDTRSN